MKSNVSPVPKAPAVSPGVAALLSVRFILFQPHHHNLPPAYRPACFETRTWPCLHQNLQASFVFIYVLPFYLSSATRPSPTLTRDAPSSIRARTRAVTFSTVICLLLTAYVLHEHHVSAGETLKLLGFWPISLVDTAQSMLLVLILFAGPIFEHGIVDGGWRDWIKLKGVYTSLSSWIGYRNYIVVSHTMEPLKFDVDQFLQGPLSEELVWRSCIVPLHVLARFSGKKIVFLTPLYFGIAHLHHLYEFRITHPDISLLVAILRSLFQFTYTSLFGFFAAFVYLRTGNVYTCMLVHTFCNWMGLPRFYGRVGVEAGVPISPPSDDQTRISRNRMTAYQGKSQIWTVAYYTILVAGAVGFYWLLFPLTQSSHALEVVLG